MSKMLTPQHFKQDEYIKKTKTKQITSRKLLKRIYYFGYDYNE